MCVYIYMYIYIYIHTLYSYPKEFADPIHPQKHQGTSLAAPESPQLFPGSPAASWRPPCVFLSEAHRHRTSSTCSLGCWDAGMGSWNWDKSIPFIATFIATFLKKMMIDSYLIDKGIDTPLDWIRVSYDTNPNGIGTLIDLIDSRSRARDLEIKLLTGCSNMPICSKS